MIFSLKGLYVITDNSLIKRNKFIITVEKALKGGANIVQLREKNTEHEEVIYLGKELLNLANRYGIPLIINDSPEVAREVGAHGVHLGEHDCSINKARSILGKDLIIGVSCYGNIERGIHAVSQGASYLAFGTPYDTPTKPGRIPTPFSVLKEAKSIIKNVPIFAIGGITFDNARDVLNTGVDGIAVITSIFGSENPEDASRDFADLFK